MLQAVLAGTVTLIAVLVVAAVIAVNRRSRGKDVVSRSHSVESVIDTVGVVPEKQQTGFGTHDHAQVRQHEAPTTAAGAELEGRFLAMGVLAAGVFGSLAAKLWSMQVLQADAYRAQSEGNLYTTIYTPAPRGIVYDSAGVPLIANRPSYAVLANADVADDHDVVQRLSTLLGIPFQVVRQRIQDTSRGVQASRVVSDDATLRNVAFISEHSQAFPGVACEMRTQRTYPYGALAAHVLGYAGVASAEELEESQLEGGRNLQSGDLVGKSGVEYEYERLLAGDHGTRTLLTDALGNVKETVSETDPTRGNDVYLTLCAPVQEAADRVLRKYVAPNGVIGDGDGVGSGAAIVCLDCTNGEVVALANFPTYTPESFIGGIAQDVWDSLNTEDSCLPLMNRALAGAYPAASTFKAFTSMAALTDRIADASSLFTCTGTWTGFGEAYAQKCWLESGHGTLNLRGGIQHSCDSVFYEIAKGFFYSEDLEPTAMQDYVKEYGFGRKTGIDLPGEAEGRIPTPEWKAEYFADAPEEAMWVGGDMSNMVIGQGYVLITPLQLACGYAGIATGRVWRPHVLREVRNSLGNVVLSYEPEVICEPEQAPEHIELVRGGLRDVITENNYGPMFFSGLDYTVAGKTGTAQVAGKRDYSWFVCYAPAEEPKYVVACLCEEGETATKAAMPAAAELLDAAMSYRAGKLTAEDMQPVSGSYAVIPRDDAADYETARED